MKTWKEFTEQLTESELLQIVTDDKKLIKEGLLGESFLRSKALEWIISLECSYNINVAIHDLTNYAYRYFTQQYFILIGNELATEEQS